MFINQAVSKVLNTHCRISRECWDGILITPTNTSDCCIISKNDDERCPRWNPEAEDLMADDWMVIKE